MKKYLFFFCFLSLVGVSQTTKKVSDLKAQYQDCLDTGEFMLNCSHKFYFQMDSILNVAYFKVYAKSNTAQKATLKAEQRNWLAKRDIYFKKTFNEFPTKNPHYAMLMEDKNADFVMNRVLELIKKIQ